MEDNNENKPNMNEQKRASANFQYKQIKGDKEVYTFAISSENIDRYVERMDIKGGIFDNFFKNAATVFYNHDSWDFPIANCLEIYEGKDKKTKIDV